MADQETADNDQRPRDLEAEGHSHEAAEELVRQAERVQDLDVDGHGILQN